MNHSCYVTKETRGIIVGSNDGSGTSSVWGGPTGIGLFLIQNWSLPASQWNNVGSHGPNSYLPFVLVGGFWHGSGWQQYSGGEVSPTVPGIFEEMYGALYDKFDGTGSLC